MDFPLLLESLDVTEETHLKRSKVPACTYRPGALLSKVGELFERFVTVSGNPSWES